MAEHIPRESKEKLEIEKDERDRKWGGKSENEKKVTLSQDPLTEKYFTTVPTIALESFIPAINSKNEKVQNAAITGSFFSFAMD